MECIALDVEGFHLRITNFDTFLVVRGIERALNFQAGFGGCRSNRLDYRHAINERSPTPGLCDVARPVTGEGVQARRTAWIAARCEKSALSSVTAAPGVLAVSAGE